VHLTDEEVVYLNDVIDWWLEDFEGATNDVIRDRSLQDPDELNKAVHGMHRLFQVAQEVKEKVSGGASPLPAL
jgi:hypothetical protein